MGYDHQGDPTCDSPWADGVHRDEPRRERRSEEDGEVVDGGFAGAVYSVTRPSARVGVGV